ncbi:MAG: hypothetical protein J6P72_01245 [Firmicutes bacterium]|nr:hypothetical protein [Bacillota bacterium]
MSEKKPQSQYDQYEFNENESSTEWSNTSNLDFMNAKEPEPIVQEQAKMVLFGVAGLEESSGESSEEEESPEKENPEEDAAEAGASEAGASQKAAPQETAPAYDDIALDLDGQIDQYLKKNQITVAVTRDGETITDQKEIRDAIRQENSSIQIYTKDKATGAIVRNRNGRIQATPVAEQANTDDLPLYEERIPQIKRSLGFDDEELLYAEDEDGNRIEGAEQILEHLQSEQGRLYVHTTRDVENPFVFDHTDETYYVSKWPVPQNQQNLLDKDAFNKFVNPAFSEEYLLKWKAEDIDFAVDENGKRYEGSDEVAAALYGVDKKLQLYLKGKDVPLPVIKQRNRFYGPDSEMLEIAQDEDQFFETITTDLTEEFFSINWQIDKESGTQELAGEKLQGAAFPRLEFALDEEGHLYRDLKTIKEQARIPGKRLFIFDDTKEPPYAVENKNGDLYKSNDRISSRCILPDTQSFDPKKSLKVDDIIKIADARENNLLKEKWDDTGKFLKFYKDNIEHIQQVKSKNRPVKPNPPKKPGLGFFGGLWLGITKVVTLGFGDTARHKNLPAKRKEYEKEMKSYENRLEKYKKEADEYDDIQKNGDQKLKTYEEGLKKTNQKLKVLREQKSQAEKNYTAQLSANSSMHVKQYRDHLEVKMEGVSDLLRKGKITEDNLFAHTWLKRAECDQQPCSSMTARRALCAYIAADALEDEILSRRVHSIETSGSVIERRLAPLNNGKAVEDLMKNPELKKILDDLGDQPMEPDDIKYKLIDRIAEKEKEEHRAIPYLNKMKAELNNTFGKHQLDEQMLEEVLRYKRFDVSIDIQNKNARAVSQEQEEERYKVAVKNTKENLRYKVSDENKDEYREAFNAIKAEKGKNAKMTLDDLSKALDNKKAELEQQKAGPGLKK